MSINAAVAEQKGFGDGAAAVLDQFLFTGSSSVLVLILGRLLDPPQYGAFVLAYSTFLLLGQGQTAMFGEPMSVFGPNRFAGQQGAYMRTVQSWNLKSGLFASAGLALVGGGAAWLGHRSFALAFIGAALAMPPLLSAWLRRRALYLQGRIWRSVLASSLFLIGCLGGIFSLQHLRLLNAFSGMAALGLASCLALVVSPLPTRNINFSTEGLMRMHWEYGRWAILTATLGWTGNIYYFLIPLWQGLASAASLRALLNFVYPVVQVNQALALYLLPRWAAQGSASSLAGRVFQASVAWTLGTMVLCGLAFILGPKAMHLVYGGKYDSIAELMPLALLLTIPDGLSYLIGNGLRASRAPQKVAIAAFVLPIVAIFPGCLLMATWGIKGVLISLILASIGQLGMNYWGWKQIIQNNS